MFLKSWLTSFHNRLFRSRRGSRRLVGVGSGIQSAVSGTVSRSTTWAWPTNVRRATQRHEHFAFQAVTGHCESLEDRTLLATITVTSLADNSTGDGMVTLREAIQAAQTDSAVDGSAAGSGADTIVFDSGIAGGSISVTTTGDSSIGRSAFLISTPITIQGTGETIQGSGLDSNTTTNNRRAFLVSSAGSLTLDNVTVTNFAHKGGNSSFANAGGGGGGGGAGLGGAIFVDAGALTLNDATLSNNNASGGDGGLASFGGTGAGGSGGGLLADAGGGAAPGGEGNGGNGAFGEGGGGGNSAFSSNAGHGGTGGFGGGAGGGGHSGNEGAPGAFAGEAGNTGGANNGPGAGGGGAGLGGAVFAQNATITISNTTFEGNSVQGGDAGQGNGTAKAGTGGDGAGGGLFVTGTSGVIITNSTFSGNNATGGQLPASPAGATVGEALGGGIFLDSGSTATVLNATLYQNSVAVGTSGGIQNNGGGLNLKNTIVAGNTNGNVNGGFTDQGTNFTSGDPMLTDLIQLEGATDVHYPRLGSPVVDTGTNAGAPANDQRSTARDANVDIGAAERNIVSPTLSNGHLIVADTSSDALLKIDPTTGNRDLVSLDGVLGTGFAFQSIQYIAVATNGDIYVTDSGSDSVFVVDPATGNRTVFSIGATDATNEGFGSAVGTGTEFESPQGLAFEASGDLLVADSTLDAVLRVDSSGNRSVISDDSTPDTNNQFSTPAGLIVHSTLGPLVVENGNVQNGGSTVSADAVIQVNASSGVRTLLSGDGNPDANNEMNAPQGIAEDTDGSILVGDSSADMLFRVNSSTGARTVVVDVSGGSNAVYGVAINGSGTVFFNDSGVDEVYRVSGASAVLVSGDGMGTGLPINGLTAGIAVWSAAAAVPELAIAATSATNAEGDSGNTAFTFTVTRTGDVSGASSASYAVTGSGGNAADAADFGGTLPSGTVSFAATETTQVITVNASGDTTVEMDEGFTVALSSPTNATLGASTAPGTIQNDDTNLAIVATNAARAEGDSGNTAFTFTVTRSGVVSGTSSANYAVIGSGGDPADAADFGGSLPSGTVSFAATETSQVITVNVSGDTTVEMDEGFTVALSSPTDATLGTSTAPGTIQNDDTNLAIAATNAARAEGDSGNSAFTFTVTRSGVVSGSSSANYAVIGSGGDPADAADFGGSLPSGTVSFAATETSQVITVNVSGDTTVESDEGFTVTLSSPSGATLGTASDTGTIQNDDTELNIAATSADKVEGNAGNTAFTFTVTRSGVVTGTSSATYTVTGSGGDQADAVDFFGGSLPTDAVNFLATETTQVITINVLGDLIPEPNEGFTVTLSSPNGATIGTASDPGTIQNDDTAIDYGDAPTSAQSGFTASYPTLIVNSGASHIITGPRLGDTVDFEVDGQPTADADGDGADEDGVTFGSLAVSTSASTGSSLQVDLQNADGSSNKLDVWIDFNQDGDWGDSGEQVATNFDLGTTDGVKTVPFTIPQDTGADVVLGATFARVRLSTAGSLAATGAATDGEVEDYKITLTDVATTTIFNLPTVDSPGDDLTTTAALTGGGSVFTLTIDGVVVYSVPVAELPSGFQINGSADADDTLVIDGANGWLTGKSLSFNGGSGGMDGITVVNLPGAFSTGVGANGSGSIKRFGQTIMTFNELEPVDFSASALTTFEIEIDPTDTVSGPVTATVTNHVNAGVTRIDFDNGLESIFFSTPSVSLTITGDPTDGDIINFEGIDASWNVPIIINGGGGQDVVTFQTTATNLGGGDLTVNADTVNINAAVSTGGGNVTITTDAAVAVSAIGSLTSAGGQIDITGLNAAPVAGASVTADGNGTSMFGADPASATLTNFSVPAGTDRLLVVDVGTFFADVTAVAFGAMNLTQAVEQDAANSTLRSELWYLPLGDSGSATVGNIAITGGTGVTSIGAASFQGVDQASPIDGTTSSTTFPNAMGPQPSTVSVSSEPGDLVLDAVFTTGGVTAPTADGSQTTSHAAADSGGGAAVGSSYEAGAASVSMDWTLNGSLVFDAAHTGLNINSSSPVTFTGDSTLTLASGSSISAGAGNITLTYDEVDVQGSVSGMGSLTFQPVDVTESIGIGGGMGTLNLDGTEISNLTDGFSNIIIGDATNGSGAVDVDDSTFADNVTIVGGSINVTGLNAGTNNVTLTARTGAITEGGNVGTDISGGHVTLQTLDATIGDIGTFSNVLSLAATSLTTDSSASDGAQNFSEANSVSAVSLNAGGGFVRLFGGEVDLASADAVNDATGVSLQNAGATLDLNGFDETLAGVSGPSGSVTLGANTLTVATMGSSSSFSGVISGSGGLIKDGTDTWFLNGANTYTGVTNVNNGILWIRNADALGEADADSNTIVAAAGELYVEGTFTVDEHLSLMGELAIGAASNSVIDWAGPIAISGGAVVIETVEAADVLTISGQVTGSGGFTKNDPGTLILSNSANDFTGAVDIVGGELIVVADNALGADGAGNGTTIRTGATLVLDGDAGAGVTSYTPLEPLTLDGGALIGIDGNPAAGFEVEFSGPIDVVTSSSIGGRGSSTVFLVLSGVISGDMGANLTAVGRVSAAVDLAAANTFDGTVIVPSRSSLIVSADGGLGSTVGGTTIGFRGVISFDDGVAYDTAEPLTLAAGALVIDDVFALFNVGAPSDVSFSGPITLTGNADVSAIRGGSVTLSGVIDGGFGLAIGGFNQGDVILSGASTYTGDTTVEGGTLLVNNTTGSGTGTGNVTVQLGAGLGGNGTISGAVDAESDSFVVPGNSPGVLATGNFDLMAGAGLIIEIDGNSGAGLTMGHDQIDVTGTVTLGGDLVLIGSYALVGGDSFTIINNDNSDAVTGIVSGLVEGATIFFNNSPLTLTYAGGVGDMNDVVLSFDDTPDITGTPGDDNFYVTINSGNLEVYTGGRDGTLVMAAALTDLTNLTINGAGGDDSLELDFGSGDFSVPITFNGGGQSTAGDDLTLTGGTFDDATFGFINDNDGTIDITGNATITYTGLEPISSSINATNVTLNYSATAETITVTDVGEGQTMVDSDVAGEMVTFNNPTGTLQINAGDTGVNIIDVTSLLASYPANVDINGGDAGDTVNLNGEISLTGTASLTVDADTVNVNSTVQTAMGSISLTAATVTLDGALTSTGGGNVLLTTDSIAVNATVTSMGALTIAPLTAATSIGLGTGTGTLSLDSTELGMLADGFSSITIGDAAAGTGAVDVDASTFTDDLTIVGGSIAVTELGAAANDLTLIARTGAITNGGDSGTDIVGGAVTLRTLDGTTGTIGAVLNEIALDATSLVTDSSASGDNQWIRDTNSVLVTSINAGTGTVFLKGGEFDLANGDAVNDMTTVSLSNPVAAATLDLNGFDETLANLGGGGSTIGNVTLGNNTLTIHTQGASDSYQGVISGSGGLVKDGADQWAFDGVNNGAYQWALGGVNTYTGATNVIIGELRILNAAALGEADADSNTIVASTGELYAEGTFTVNEHLDLMGELAIGGPSNSIIDWAGPVAISGTAVVMETVLVGDELTISGQITGSGGFTKNGPGSLILTGNNTYAGTTVVTTGTLLVNSATGSGTGTSDLTIQTGALLGGTGSISGNVTIDGGGTAAPGESPGILAVGNVNFLDNSTFEVEIGGTSPGNTATDHDQLAVTGSVTIGNTVTLDVTAFGGFVPVAGDSFTIIDNDGTADAVMGTFDSLPEGTVIPNFLGSGLPGVISYTGGDGNDVVILADRPTYDFSMATFAAAEGDATNTTNVVTLTRSGATSIASTVDVVLTADTATTGTDFTAGPITVSFGIGETTQVVPIEILGEAIVELDETIDLSLTNFSNSGQAGTTNSTATFTITNEDAATLSINDVTLDEGDAGPTLFTFTVTLNAEVDTTIDFNFATADGTTNAATTADNDYTGLSVTSRTFASNAAGATETITVQVNGDAKVELDETFFVNLSNIAAGGRDVTFATGGDQGIGTITNADAATLSIDDVTLKEGDAGPTLFTFTVTLDAEVDTGVDFEFATADGTTTAATTADSDYTGLSVTSRSFASTAAGSTETITVQVTGDTKVELDETFFVNLSNIAAGGRDVTFADSQGLGTITNEDTGVISVANASGAENGGPITVTVNLSNPVDVATSATISLADGTATVADNDYTTATPTVNFAAGATSATFTFNPTADIRVESDETVWANVSSVSDGGRNVTASPTPGTITITNDDQLPLIVIGGDPPDRPPFARIVDPATGEELIRINTLHRDFEGGVRVGAGDLNNDGIDDIIAGAGPGGGPHVQAFDGATGDKLIDFYAYHSGFRGGVFVATGDINNDGQLDIITGAGEGGGPHIRAFDGSTGARIANFFAFGVDFTGGVRVAAGDVNNDGFDDIITSTGPGSAANVRVFSGQDGSTLHSFVAYNSAWLGGAYIAAGDVNGDGQADIITGAGATGGPHVRVFDGATGARIGNFFAYGTGDRAGIRVAASDVTGDGLADILVNPATGRANAPVGFDPSNGYARVNGGLEIADLGLGFYASAPTLRDPAANIAPEVANTIQDQTATSGTEFNFTVPADTFRDRDRDDVLTLSATLSDSNPLPAWLTFNASTQTFTGTPAAPGDVGAITIRVTVTDSMSGSASDDFSLTVRDVAAPQPASSQIVIGAGEGKAPWVQVIDASTGNEVRRFLAYNSGFRGGVDVAMADVNNDGTDDIITGAGPSGGPHVKVFDGATGNRLASFFPFDVNFRGGVHVAAADVNGDGYADVITGAGVGGSPTVRVFNGQDMSVLHSFNAYTTSFFGGVDVAGGDVNGDGNADIITGAGPGGGPHVKVFDGSTGDRLQSFFAYSVAFTGGVSVSAADVNGDGMSDVVTGAGSGSGEVRVFDARTMERVHRSTPFGAGFTGGINVGSTNANNDLFEDVIVGKGSGRGPHVDVLSGSDFSSLDSFFAFDPEFSGGVFVD